MERRVGWVYGLFDIETPERIRYAGKTISRRGVADRVYHHVWGAKKLKASVPSADWIRKIGGERVGYAVLEEVDAEKIDEAEIRWIRDLRSQGLADLNVTEGGDGQSSDQVSGDKNPRAKLTWEIVRELRQTAQTRYTPTSEFAQTYGLTPAAVSKILRNSTWFDPEYDSNSRIQISLQNSGTDRVDGLVWRTLTDSDVEKMRSEYLQGKTVTEIHKSTGHPITSIRRALFEKYGSESSRVECVTRKNWVIGCRDKLK